MTNNNNANQLNFFFWLGEEGKATYMPEAVFKAKIEDEAARKDEHFNPDEYL